MSTNPPGQQPDKNRFSQQIDDAFTQASKLAGSTLAPTDFYEKFLNVAITAIGAPAGAVWLRTPQGFLQVACQLNLDKVGLDAKRGGRQCHNEILRQVFQAQPPRSVMIEPQGQVSGLAEPGQVPARNLTDFFTLFAPIVQPDKSAMGLLEIFQDSTHDPRMYPTFLNYSVQMAGYASQYHTFSNTRQAAGLDKVYTQVEAFARLIHSTLNPTECAYHVANEGRRLIECDRLCVGIRHGKKSTVEAVSGADVVEKAATHVRRMRQLFDSVLTWGDKLVFKGEKDESLPPAVLHALDDYLAESQPKLLVIQPIRDEREKDDKKPARSVLLLESFNPPENIEPMIQKLDIVAKHAASALYNAAELKSIPLKTLWWPVKKVQDGLGGKARLITASIVAALIALTVAMVLVPYQLKMDAKGELQPTELHPLYPREAGKLRKLLFKPGDKINPDAIVAEMFSEEIGEKLFKVSSEIEVRRARVNKMKSEATTNFSASDLATHNQRLAEDEANIKSNELLRQQMIQDSNLDLARPGLMYVKAPRLDPSKVKADAKLTVLNSDNSNELMNRVLKQNEAIQKLGYTEGEWHIQVKVPQRNLGHILKAFADKGMHQVDDKGKKYLDVDLLVTSESDTKYYGRLYEDELARDVIPNRDDHNESEPISIGFVKIDVAQIPENRRVPRTLFASGQEVHIRIRCGEHALGYSLFHGVWEWFYEKVIFFF
ncbi:efflux RND transporter periplasmic adaptor subunit [Limnoglobus roseus]|uniref:HlyD family secretion protein n=1 Tax=Limnoglobus roseus TaxID=2598579 RepID=A0A5C1AH97_9BACT|nr:hypothetical protein [Limnoglobus roseus]QEL18190.1 hypothetical protein PX52LOC_05204 [Limnoglobus roseus]